MTELEALEAKCEQLKKRLHNLEGRLSKKAEQLGEKDKATEAERKRAGVYRAACAALLAGHALGGEKFEQALEAARQVVNEQG